MLRQTADCECHGSCESHDISAGLFAITLWQNQASALDGGLYIRCHKMSLIYMSSYKFNFEP